MNRQNRLQATAVIAPPSIPDQGRPGRGAAATPGSAGPRHTITLNLLFNRLISFFSSLRLTVVCLGLGLVLIFWGTLAQVELGLFKAQNEFFRSFFIYWTPKVGAWR